MINIVRSQPEPKCLEIEKSKKDGSYACDDVELRLKNDFHNKCYLCEEKEISTINIEHFKPHKGNKDLKFDWNNLFWSCGHCNNTKLAKKEFDLILNCTNPKHKILEMIRFDIKPFPFEEAKITARFDEPIIQNTVMLLQMIYNGSTNHKEIEGANIRQKLIEEIRDFGILLSDYFDDTHLEYEKNEIKQRIRRKLSPQSAFTAFKICIVQENNTLLQEFSQFLPQ